MILKKNNNNFDFYDIVNLQPTSNKTLKKTLMNAQSPKVEEQAPFVKKTNGVTSKSMENIISQDKNNVKHSLREGTNTRELLAEALSNVTQNAKEDTIIKTYRKQIELANNIQNKIDELTNSHMILKVTILSKQNSI